MTGEAQWHSASTTCVANVAFLPASNDPFDLDKFNDMTQQAFGYGAFWYWKLFTAPDGPALMKDHLDSMYDVTFAADPDARIDTFCKRDGFRDFLQSDQKMNEVRTAAETRSTFIERYARDGFEAPVCWYRATVEGHQVGEADESNMHIRVPSLFVAYAQDYVCRHEFIKASLDAGLLIDFTQVTLQGGHWGLREHPQEFATTVLDWIDGLTI
jgi:soluble epoxide hydrolase/lipid-phosphate phosphatase